ncbi:bromodomain and PHD finger-containing protein 3 [Exophiala viscosa]|uniref:Bromodomain and PHD finger-containing protein 3 n=1 Tax=Exophiala viscosa TaxID=2486360 RepID=A0AAN6DSK9_9EURO|nr:bromodomain and PHD finger-containing protein 3 [Exophiala viscosa]
MSATDNFVQAKARSNSPVEKQVDAPSENKNGVPPSGPANSTPTTSVEVSPAPETALPLETPQSQPMTATASSSSQNPPQENGGASAAGSYGTRSRHRTGTRPNYAEDKDLDVELDASPKVSRASKRSSAANEQHTTATSSGFAAINHSASENPSDNVPTGGTSTPVPSATPAPSKKRKHPGSSHPVASTHHTMPANARSRHAVSVPLKGFVETNMMSFNKYGRKLNAKKQLVSDDGSTVQANDHVYMVCEPPGEPYYLARIMEFLHAKNDPEGPVDALRVNWYYRPKDIQRRVQDTRVVFASMHSDTCPLNSIRGKCNIQHLSAISNMDDYRSQQDSFWFDKLFDRYMLRYYEVIPTTRVVNVPQHVKAVLDERWKFVLVEIGRGRELTSESKKCTRCEQFASNHDSVDCAVCKRTYHMQCVRPPLLKKPARGFAWACAACSRAQEMKMDARHTPAGSEAAHGDDDDFMDEDDDEPANKAQETRESSVAHESHPQPTPAQIAQANLWPWRYLGVHSRPEDALDYDDRIYPRASSRLGPRHQANINVWHGRPVEMVKPAEIKKKYKNTDRKSGKSSKDVAADIDKDLRLKRPKWVVDEPVGYIARGHDEAIEIKGKKEHTTQLIFKMPDQLEMSERGTDDVVRPPNAEELVDEFMKRVKPIAAQYNLLDSSVDFLTKAVEKLQENDFNIDKALDAMKGLSLRADLKQPDLNREEIKRFEEGVSKYGSELHAVSRHVGSSVKESRIVRYYYMWKKTDKGRQIWGNFEGRRSKKESKRVDKDGNVIKTLDDVADDQDDSAFDEEKAAQKKRGFVCKFCATHHSRQWRRAPATPPGTLVPKDPSAKNSKDKSGWLTLALCGRCAYLWRKYAVQYEDIEEVSKKIASSGSRAAKRKVDEELLRLILEAHQMSGDPIPPRAVDEVNKAGLEVPHNIIQPDEPPKKKGKTDKDGAHGTPDVVPEKKKAPEKPQEPPPIEPDPPKVKIHPCAVCRVIDVPGQELLKCRDCRLHVHGSCYGVGPNNNTKPWFCDMCRNDHNLQVSTTYECVLCPIKYTAQELMEPLRPTHKKKTERDREKERIEREIIQEASRRWRMEQEAAGRPVNPREALKRTAWNNWMHITCALWTKEIKFGNAELLDDAEGVGFIPAERFEPPCKICKQAGYPTVKCQQSNCNSFFHIGCAHQSEYVFGFDVAPVKSSRRDSTIVMKLDSEAGIVTAGIWCPTHLPTTFVHNILEPTEAGLTAMQLFARTYKQVDNSVTGTVRRAAQFTANLPTTATTTAVQPAQRRDSLVNGLCNGTNGQVDRITDANAAESPRELEDEPLESRPVQSTSKKTSAQKKCCTCLVDVSPRWWPLERAEMAPAVTNGFRSEPGAEHGALDPSQDVVMTNGIVKAEPADTNALGSISEIKDRVMWQCHKCHILKRTPPPSPSQVRPRQLSPERLPEPVAYQSSYAVPPPPAFPLSRPSMDTALPPPHSHPPPLGAPPPQPPSWQNNPGGWSSSSLSSGRRPSPPPLGGGYPSAYRQPPHDAPAYNRPPHHSWSTVPPPPPPPPAAGHLAQHSPPPAPYGSATHHHPAPVPTAPPANRGLSPPRYDRVPMPSPHLGLQQSILSRSFAPEPPRQPSLGSPVNGYAAPHSTAPRLFSQAPPPPPPPSSLARHSPSTQSLAHIAQAAADQGGLTHSRQASVDGTPRFGARAIPESPQQRPITPAGPPALKEERKEGPGASASPSLRNLLS